MTTILFPPLSYAQSRPLFNLPPPGIMLEPSQALLPPMFKGVTIDPVDPFRFNFIFAQGGSKLASDQIHSEAQKLARYFLVALTVPDEELWVNLSPYEKDRVIPDRLSQTELGRDLLAEDYILKQFTASLINPERDLGKRFWDGIYQKTFEKFGVKEIPLKTFNKVWILPDKAVVYEKDGTAFIVESRLKVLLESDYLALKENKQSAQDQEYISQIMREIIIPAIEQEVNEGAHFAQLRQIYQAVILAGWYKTRLKESFLAKAYIDQNKVRGIDVVGAENKEEIYGQYLEAFKKGIFNFIKEDYDPHRQVVTQRNYFSGGSRLTVTQAIGDLPPVLKVVTPESVESTLYDKSVADFANKNSLYNIEMRFETDKALSTDAIRRMHKKVIPKMLLINEDSIEGMEQKIRKRFGWHYKFETIMEAKTQEEALDILDRHPDISLILSVTDTLGRSRFSAFAAEAEKRSPDLPEMYFYPSGKKLVHKIDHQLQKASGKILYLNIKKNGFEDKKTLVKLLLVDKKQVSETKKEIIKEEWDQVEVIEAGSHQEALYIMAKHPDITVVLSTSDPIAPGDLDGAEFARRVYQRNRSIPIIMQSSVDSWSDPKSKPPKFSRNVIAVIPWVSRYEQFVHVLPHIKQFYRQTKEKPTRPNKKEENPGVETEMNEEANVLINGSDNDIKYIKDIRIQGQKTKVIILDKPLTESMMNRILEAFRKTKLLIFTMDELAGLKYFLPERYQFLEDQVNDQQFRDLTKSVDTFKNDDMEMLEFENDMTQVIANLDNMLFEYPHAGREKFIARVIAFKHMQRKMADLGYLTNQDAYVQINKRNIVDSLINLRIKLLDYLQKLPTANWPTTTITAELNEKEKDKFGYIERLKGVLGDNLKAVVVYGTAAYRNNNSEFADYDNWVFVENVRQAYQRVKNKRFSGYNTHNKKSISIFLVPMSMSAKFIAMNSSPKTQSKYLKVIYGSVELPQIPQEELIQRGWITAYKSLYALRYGYNPKIVLEKAGHYKQFARKPYMSIVEAYLFQRDPDGDFLSQEDASYKNNGDFKNWTTKDAMVQTSLLLSKFGPIKDGKLRDTDHAVASQEENDKALGGINLSQSVMPIKIQGDHRRFSNNAEWNIHIDGLVPVIIHITPLFNLPALLGMTDPTDIPPDLSAVRPEDLARF